MGFIKNGQMIAAGQTSKATKKLVQQQAEAAKAAEAHAATAARQANSEGRFQLSVAERQKKFEASLLEQMSIQTHVLAEIRDLLAARDAL